MGNIKSIVSELTARKITRQQWLLQIMALPPHDDCIEWPFAISTSGYGNIYFRGRHVNAHRAVCKATHGDPPESKMQAAHRCGNKSCVNPAHIRWATPVANNKDKIGHGTHRRGERNNLAKLTLEEVLAIRRFKAENPELSLDKIAFALGYKRNTIWKIITNRTWNTQGIGQNELRR